jgi:predicted nucleic acid-binding protein
VSSPVTRVVVTDANVLINLLHVSRLDLLSTLPGHEFVVPEHVAGRLLGTPDIFVVAIRAGLLSVEEADADKLALEKRRFKLSFGSYRELVK